MIDPQWLERRRQPERRLGVRALETPLEGGAEVVDVGLNTVEPPLDLLAPRWLEPGRHQQVVIAVTGPDGYGFGFARLGQLLERVLADCLEQPVPGGRLRLLG